MNGNRTRSPWGLVLLGLLGVLGGLPAWAAEDDEISWFGDLRVRYDGRDRSDAIYSARGRYRLRVGWTAQHLDGLIDWRVRVASAPDDPVSRNQTLLGRAGNEETTFGLDELYVGVHPSDELLFLVGKQPLQAPWGSSDSLFDGDVTMPGVFARWNAGSRLVDGLTVRAGVYSLQSLFGAHTEPYLAGLQLNGKVGPTTVTLGGFHYDSLQQFNFRTMPWSQMTNHFANLDLNGDGVNETRRMVDDSITTWRARVDLPFEFNGYPLKAGFEYLLNSAASSQKAGYEVRLDAPEFFGGKAYVIWRDLGQNATFSSFADSDFGEGTGYRSGIKFGYSRVLNDWLNLDFTYFHYDRFQPLNTGAPRDTDRIMVDLVGKW